MRNPAADWTREELVSAFKEITEWAATGVLCDGAVRALARDWSKGTQQPHATAITIAKDMIVSEMAKRYAERAGSPRGGEA